MKRFYFFVFTVMLLFATSCSFSRLGSKSPFSIDEAKYTLYKGKEGNKGLVEFNLDHVTEGIKVESIIFNRLLVPVTQQKTTNDGLNVVAKFLFPVDGEKGNYIDKSNRIIYSINGKEDFVQYNEIKKQPHPIVVNW